MPMSSLKVLIKFTLSNRAVDFERIKALFWKSSVDAKACILENLYHRAVADVLIQKDFHNLIKIIAKPCPEAFSLFFSVIYKTESTIFNL